MAVPVTMASGICSVYFMLSSKMRHWEQMLVLALLSMLLMAQQKPKFEIREIKATGCVRRAAESQCLLLETLDGAATYTFIVAPKPELNAVIKLSTNSLALSPNSLARSRSILSASPG